MANGKNAMQLAAEAKQKNDAAKTADAQAAAVGATQAAKDAAAAADQEALNAQAAADAQAKAEADEAAKAQVAAESKAQEEAAAEKAPSAVQAKDLVPLAGSALAPPAMQGLADEVERHKAKDPTLVELVIVTVPKAFNLTLDNQAKLPIRAGTQQMFRFLAQHWYCVNNGVKIFDPVADAKKKVIDAKAQYDAALEMQKQADAQVTAALKGVSDADADTIMDSVRGKG